MLTPQELRFAGHAMHAVLSSNPNGFVRVIINASLRLFFVRFYCHNYYFLFSHPEEEIDDSAAHLQSSNKAVELWTFE